MRRGPAGDRVRWVDHRNDLVRRPWEGTEGDDEKLDRGSDYARLLLSHLRYKAAILQPAVLKAFFLIILPWHRETPGGADGAQHPNYHHCIILV